jgi:hypothetical protein
VTGGRWWWWFVDRPAPLADGLVQARQPGPRRVSRMACGVGVCGSWDGQQAAVVEAERLAPGVGHFLGFPECGD